MTKLEGRLFLITGASSGIGLAAARRLAEEGAQIVAVARRADKLAAAVATLPGAGHQAVAADATRWDQLEPLIAVGRDRGGWAGAVAAAGLHMVKPLSLVDTDHLHQMFDANVTSALLATKVVMRAPRKEGASVVWMSSVAALRGTAGFPAYSAAKGALISAARVAAAELATKRIRVNTIAAGVVLTEMSEGWLGKLTPEQRSAVEATHLLGLGRPEDVASAIAYLVSDDARWVTGSTLVVDGGLSAR